MLVRRPSFTLLLIAYWKLQTTPLNDHLLWSHVCPTASGFLLPRSCFYPPQSRPHIWRGNLCSPPTKERTHHFCTVFEPMCILETHVTCHYIIWLLSVAEKNSSLPTYSLIMQLVHSYSKNTCHLRIMMRTILTH